MYTFTVYKVHDKYTSLCAGIITPLWAVLQVLDKGFVELWDAVRILQVLWLIYMWESRVTVFLMTLDYVRAG